MHEVLVLWRDVFQPKRLAVLGPEEPLNVVAATSLDGKTVTFKAVNTGTEAVAVTVEIDESQKIESAEMQLIAPGSTNAQNTLTTPDTVKAAPAPVTVTGKTLEFTMPAVSVGAVTVFLVNIDTNCAYDETVARTIGDTNYDCEVNLVDFAAMAENWLTNVSF
jgi:hypothetical protein